MALQDLENQLYDIFGFDTAPQSAVTTRFRRFLNITQREILGEKGCERLRQALLTFSTVADSPFAVLPQAAVNLRTIQDRTNAWVLDPVSLQDLRAEDPGLQRSGNPDRYVVVNYASPVAKDPSGATGNELFVKSDSVSDGSTKTLYIEGITNGGNYRTASVALNGVTAASLGATITTWIRVTKCYLALTTGGTPTTAAGNVTLHQDSGAGTELARITIGRSRARYTLLHMYPTPSASQTYYADVDLHIEDMSTLADESYVPEDFQWVLVAGAAEKEWRRRGKIVEAGEEGKRYRAGKTAMRLFLRRTGGVAQGLNRRANHRQVGLATTGGVIW